jgi:hypothetical protein
MARREPGAPDAALEEAALEEAGTSPSSAIGLGSAGSDLDNSNAPRYHPKMIRIFRDREAASCHRTPLGFRRAALLKAYWRMTNGRTRSCGFSAPMAV